MPFPRPGGVYRAWTKVVETQKYAHEHSNRVQWRDLVFLAPPKYIINLNRDYLLYFCFIWISNWKAAEHTKPFLLKIFILMSLWPGVAAPLPPRSYASDHAKTSNRWK